MQTALTSAEEADRGHPNQSEHGDPPKPEIHSCLGSENQCYVSG